ncbi:hypothetical protein RBG61_10460 [Paludicola sp. MB14-C6]|uniref:hypothetical protein n=1 Tax=Paludihabitans sp. MB14-C6 TaxID=3070656 RepID=UPI0027DE2682|nr:hypothetical protein [Paludicola sp. MB14-C6]WMJ22407.1 hypothetical protein RBG61_10460 [Paludicola sp. MB14-C6]
MKQNNVVSSVVKGLATGAVVGTASYMMSNARKSRGRNVRKTASKAMKAVGTVIENVSYLMK